MALSRQDYEMIYDACDAKIASIIKDASLTEEQMNADLEMWSQFRQKMITKQSNYEDMLYGRSDD